MKELPILFSAPMVRAIIEGRKVQTRRVVKPQPQELPANPSGRAVVHEPCPYGQPGARLWVREAWRVPASLDDLSGKGLAEKCLDAGYRMPWCPLQFEADGARTSEKEWREFGPHPSTNVPGRYRHARFMPRWASRITLEITDVRVQRLQEISVADAIAEGVKSGTGGICGDDDIMVPIIMSDHDMRNLDKPMMPAPIARFVLLWDSINGKKQPGVTNWNANPWVWALAFRQVAP